MSSQRQHVDVSVVIPTYNRARTLKRSMESVMMQTFESFELLVVDDGSSDDTETVVRSFGDPRVRYLRPYEGNRGPSAARNAGIQAASGRYIAFQDSDDLWSPEKLQRQVQVLTEAVPKVGVVYAKILRRSPNGETVMPRKGSVREGDLRQVMLAGNPVGTPVALVRTDLLQRIGGFDEQLTAMEDWDLFLRLSQVCDFAFIDEILCFSLEMKDGISLNQERVISNLSKLLEKHQEAFRLNRRAYMAYCLDVGRYQYSQGKVALGRRYIMKAVAAYPWRPTPLILSASMILGRRGFMMASRSIARAASLRRGR